MSQLRLNIIANYLGLGWTAFLTTALIPLYIYFIGIEAWGLVGLEITLFALCTLLDLGLPQTMVRDLARLFGQPEHTATVRNILWTTQLFFIGVGCFLVLLLWSISPWLATHWLKAKQLPLHQVTQALTLAGFVLATRRLLVLFENGLAGIQKQWLSNSIRIPLDTLRHIITLLILWRYAPSIQTYFFCQIAFNLVGAVLLGSLLWHNMPKASHSAKWSTSWLLQNWRFSLGNLGIQALYQLNYQLDKILLSNLLSLKMFGYYSLAIMVSSGLRVFVNPMLNIAYPKLSQLYAQNEQQALKRMYHLSTQIIATLLLPVTFFIFLHSFEILLLWTRNPVTADQVHLLLSILIVGHAISNLMHLARILQLAHGWVRWFLLSQGIILLVYVPTLFVITSLYGAIGAACLWGLFRLAHLILNIFGMHRRILPTEQWAWYKNDILLPGAVALFVLCSGYLWFPLPDAPLWKLTVLVFQLLLAIACTALSTSFLRQWLLQKVLCTSQKESPDLNT